MQRNRGTQPAARTPQSGKAHAAWVFAAGAACGVIWTVALGLATRDRELTLVDQVMDLAEDEFVASVDREQLVDDALRGMLAGLDRYSRFYGPDDIARLDRETYGEFPGIGVVFRPPAEKAQILFPFPGSPAARAGLRVGDRLLSVDGVAIEELMPLDLQRHIQQRGGQSITLVVLGLDGEQRTHEVEPERIVDPTVRHARMLDAERGIGYLAILSFSHRTPEEFDESVGWLHERGMRSLVVDLRSNPGGILDAAVELANRFVDDGTIVATETRAGTRVIDARPERAELQGLPLVLLVDEGSASASEVLAGALQDHAAAALVGEHTYGKGTVQTLTRIGDDRAIVKLTTANYFTPGGRRIERDPDSTATAGIAPDVRIEITDEERSAIHGHLSTYPPPPSVLPDIEAWGEAEGRELLPERPRDRQLEVALELLAGNKPDPDASRLE